MNTLTRAQRQARHTWTNAGLALACCVLTPLAPWWWLAALSTAAVFAFVINASSSPMDDDA